MKPTAPVLVSPSALEARAERAWLDSVEASNAAADLFGELQDAIFEAFIRADDERLIADLLERVRALTEHSWIRAHSSVEDLDALLKYERQARCWRLPRY